MDYEKYWKACGQYIEQHHAYSSTYERDIVYAAFMAGAQYALSQPVSDAAGERAEIVKGLGSMQARYVAFGFDACLERVAKPLEARLTEAHARIEVLKAQLEKSIELLKDHKPTMDHVEAVISEERRKVRALETEAAEQCRINGMGAQRELKLISELDQERRKVEMLEARIAELEKRIAAAEGVY